MPALPNSLLLQAAAVDPHGKSGGPEVHVAQHGQPAVFVFDHKGDFLRLWGQEGIASAHGLKAQVTKTVLLFAPCLFLLCSLHFRMPYQLIY